MKCYICGSEHNIQKEGKVRDSSKINILECQDCGLVFLDKQETDDEYYKASGMRKDFKNSVEVLTLNQNLSLTDNERRIDFIKQNFSKDINLLDFGSGLGHFLILAKENHFLNICGIELEERVKSVYFDHNITLYENLDYIQNDSLDVVTLFHCIAHIHDPIMLLKRLSEKLKKNGKIIIETPNANDALLDIYKNKGFSNFTYQKCMLYHFNKYSLYQIARKSSLDIDFIKHIQRYPLSNTLYWLNNNLPAGQKYWGSIIDNKNLQNAYEATLASIGATDTLFAQFSKI
ncbi:class I SAM-dependent methyltransferase [Campylobacter jejuni]|nr:class I SAM-dependent methyltransferase [Campylobacter jejuni]